MWPDLLTDRFRRLPALSFDFVHEPEATRPNVIVVEPDYGRLARSSSVGMPATNHPPVPISSARHSCAKCTRH